MKNYCKRGKAAMPDRIILLDDKGIAETGNHDELMANNKKYAEMFRIQSQYYTD